MPSLALSKSERNVHQQLTNEWFSYDYWSGKGAISGHAKGRNITWFIHHNDDEWVLRHYYRGGMVAKILKDRYLFTSLEKTRSYQELALLTQMYQKGLAVPKPIAARVCKKGLFYTADILIEKIPNSKSLVQYLSKTPLCEASWHEAGVMIAQFHQADIYHSDLNAHNILIDNDSKYWLIDFDKCCSKKPSTTWQSANLARLQRSLNKEKLRHQSFHFDTLQWSWLLQGYQSLLPLTKL